jgi:hypothetical protein
MTTEPQPADCVAHPKDCICFDGVFCELQIDAYEHLKSLVGQTFDLDDVIADQAIEAMYGGSDDQDV